MYTHAIETYNFKKGEIIKRENDSSKYKGVIYWHFKYKYLLISIYFDESDKLGIVGQPYYEIFNVSNTDSKMNFHDTIRFLYNDQESLIKELEKQANIHDEEIEMYPERFI